MAKKTNGRRKTGSRKPGTRRGAARTSARRGAAKRTAHKRPGGSGTRAAARKPSASAKAAAQVKGALKGAVAAVTRKVAGSGIDAITLLENDHRELEKLFERGEETGGRAAKERKELLDTIAARLTVHETIEERVLYPALKTHPEARDIVLEGFQEHHVADLIVKELYDTATTDEDWAAKFKVLKENIEHHIDEEEGKMFRTARGVMTREQLVDLGTKMAKMKAAAERDR